MKLIFSAITKYISALIITCLLLFISSSTIKYYNAWLLLLVLFLPILFFGIYLYIKKPKLLERRLKSKEKEKTQKIVILFSGILFVFDFIICGLDFKYKWSNIPLYIEVIACITLLLSYFIYIKIMKENEYLLRTIEVEKNQKLVDTGLYSVIRHPMYLSVILLFLSIPLVLGSLYGFYLFLIFPMIIILRIQNEEKVLVQKLKGYSAYKLKVKYKLIPYIW